MTVAATTRRAGPYAGNGVTTTFDFEFKVFASTDIAVVLADEIGTETDLVLNSDYSVSLNADQNADPGGTITYPISGSPMATGEVLAIVGDLAYSQTTQLPNGGAYNASVVERALDRVTILVQQILETATRGVQLAVTAATDVSSILPAPVANFLVAWNPTATALVNVDPAVVQGSQAFASWIVDTFDGTGTVGGEYAMSGTAGGIGNVDVSVAGITQRAGIDFTFYNNVVTSVAAWPVGTDNVLIRYGEAVSVADIPVESSMITDSTAVGRAVLTAVNAAAARTAIGAQATLAYTAADDSAVVHKTGNETIAGTKTFSTQPVLPQAITLGTAVAATSGTAIDFTGIPAWAKRITISFNGISSNGVSGFAVQVGAGSIASSGYLSMYARIVGAAASSSTLNTSSFVFTSTSSSTDTQSGSMILTLVSPNVWACQSLVFTSGYVAMQQCAGNVSLGGTLDRIRLATVNGTDTFDAGSVNILYE